MVSPLTSLSAVIGMVALLSCAPAVAQAEDSDRKPCVEDAMLVFDASGSMAGNVNQGIATITPRIDAVRSALAKILPSVTRLRRVGLITYGPGPYQQCNVQLNLKPTPNAGELIMREVNALTPGGKTPLTAAVGQAAEVLDYRTKPGVIVVLNRWRGDLRRLALRPRQGAPCGCGQPHHPRHWLPHEEFFLDRRAEHSRREMPR
jgi:Ca-activated chloride channel homolog